MSVTCTSSLGAIVTWMSADWAQSALLPQPAASEASATTRLIQRIQAQDTPSPRRPHLGRLAPLPTAVRTRPARIWHP